jgi:hypothetical protein
MRIITEKQVYYTEKIEFDGQYASFIDDNNCPKILNVKDIKAILSK